MCKTILWLDETKSEILFGSQKELITWDPREGSLPFWVKKDHPACYWHTDKIQSQTTFWCGSIVEELGAELACLHP